jgi:hypothetical protein
MTTTECNHMNKAMNINGDWVCMSCGEMVEGSERIILHL